MTLDAADRKILLVAFSVLIITLVIAAVVAPSGSGSSGYPSPYSADSGGAKAAYTLLSQAGYQVEHWRLPPAKLLERGPNSVLVIVEVTQTAMPEDRQNIRRYVQAGGRLVAIGQTSSALLPRADIMPGLPHFAWQNYRALLPDSITSNAPEITLAPGFYWNRNDPASNVDFGDSQHGVVASYKYGKGDVIWWASADPLTNSGITQKSNLQLFLNSIGPAQSRAVLWDDYFHEGEVTLLESLLASPLKWSLLQLGLLALAVVFTYSRRCGPVRTLPRSSPMATLEFVETLGALYQRAGATELPVQVAYERFRHLLFRKLGISTSATPQQVSNRIEGRLGDLGPQCEQLLSQCESARYQGEIGQQESLRLVGLLEAFSQHLKLNS
ncbi:MAG TPA: DUF4350 domain-containing protein [Terriglobales bacterium]|nr:DUF4350 domain-containing protein [Terriglobales bacterium]